MRRNRPGTGSAVQKDYWHTFGVAALLPIDMMRIIDRECAGFVGFDFGK